MPTPRDVMEAQKQRLMDQAEQIERDMRELERLVTKYELCVIVAPTDLPPPEKVTRTNFARAAREAESIIRAAGRPLTINELFRIIQLERHIELIARDARGQLLATIISIGRLQSIPDVGWWLKGVQWPLSAEEIAEIQKAPIDGEDAPLKAGRRRGPENQRIFEIVRAFLTGKDKPTKFMDIMKHLESVGIATNDKDKKERGRIATFLSTVHCFKSHKRAGWRYIPQFDDELLDVMSPIQEPAEPTGHTP